MATARMPQPTADDPVKVDPKHYFLHCWVREWRNRGGMLVYLQLTRREGLNRLNGSRISMFRTKCFAGSRCRTRRWLCRKSATYTTGS
jgi:hypothetical protein